MSKCPAHSFAMGPGLIAAGMITGVANGALHAAPGIGRAIGEGIRQRRNFRRAAEWNAIFEEHRMSIERIDAVLLAGIDMLEGIDGKMEQLRFRKLSLSRQFDLVDAELNDVDPPPAPEFVPVNENVEVQARVGRDELMESLLAVFDEAREIAVENPVVAEAHLAAQINEAVTEAENFKAFVMSNVEAQQTLEAECQAIQENLEVLKDLRDKT